MYPGLLDRAYYSGRAIIWIHMCAMCKDEELAKDNIPLPHIGNRRSDNSGLNSLPDIYDLIQPWNWPPESVFDGCSTPEHMQWVLRTLLQFFWIKRTDPPFLVEVARSIWLIPWKTIPLDAILDLFLVWSLVLGCPIQEEALKFKIRRTPPPVSPFISLR